MKKYIFGIITGMLIMFSIGVGAIILINAKEVDYKPTDTSWNVSDVSSALDELYENNNCSFADIENLNISWNFDYIGNEQEFNIGINGRYKLELWGAQGGTVKYNIIGGYGAYSTGIISGKKGENYT